MQEKSINLTTEDITRAPAHAPDSILLKKNENKGLNGRRQEHTSKQ